MPADRGGEAKPAASRSVAKRRSTPRPAPSTERSAVSSTERPAVSRRRSTSVVRTAQPALELLGFAALGPGYAIAAVAGVEATAGEQFSGIWRVGGEQEPVRGKIVGELPSSTPGVVAILPLPHTRLEHGFALSLEASEPTARPRRTALSGAGVSGSTAEDFASAHLAGLDRPAREALLAAAISHLAAQADALALCAPGLSSLRERLRLHLPLAAAEPDAVFSAHVDAAWRVDSSSVYIEGWILDRRSLLAGLRLVSAEGRHIDLDGLLRYDRPDLAEFFHGAIGEKHGFIAFVELPEPAVLGRGWLLQAETLLGTGVEVALPGLIDDPGSLRTTMLGDLDHDQSEDRRYARRHIAPALTRLQARLASQVAIASVDQHGVPPEAPSVSLVVPLYRRTEFLEHQLAQFVHDPDFAAADLIYVVDSPEDGDRLRNFAGHLHALYGVPFRLVTLTESGGYSIANNLGASLARGRLLVLLNSDILPDRPGWLSRLQEFYDGDATVGALAPKLLYEDDSIQHAGLFFDRPSVAEAWSNEHFYKGLHRAFPAANVARRVPAVSGACLMIDTATYRELGGLRGMYVRGDYEDTDLCLRLRELGRESWYLPDVELYHLEGQSYPAPWREPASRYNQWLHSDVWRSTLEAIEVAP